MKVDSIHYKLSYRKDSAVHEVAGEHDYYYARYLACALYDKEQLKVKRIKTLEDGSIVEENIEPLIRSDYDARYAVFGTTAPALHVDYSTFIKTEGEADAFARGVENGIARAALFMQSSACNVHSSVGDVLDEYAEEILAYAPSYQVRLKSLGETMRENKQLQSQLKELQQKAAEALAEYQAKLGKQTSFGIMDLPKTRAFLELASEG